MGGNNSKGTELEVFKEKKARLNLALVGSLFSESPQTTKTLLKQITRQKRLSGTYYASLNKRLNNLLELGIIGKAKPKANEPTPQAFELRPKGYLAFFLHSYSMQQILDLATDAQAAQILLALLNVVLDENGKNDF